MGKGTPMHLLSKMHLLMVLNVSLGFCMAQACTQPPIGGGSPLFVIIGAQLRAHSIELLHSWSREHSNISEAQCMKGQNGEATAEAAESNTQMGPRAMALLVYGIECGF